MLRAAVSDIFRPCRRAIRLSAMSIPAETPDEVRTSPSSTQRAFRFQSTRGPCWITQSQAILFDVAGRPSRRPVRASSAEPVQTVVVMRARRLAAASRPRNAWRSEEHTSELQSRLHLVCRLLLEKKKTNNYSP